MSHSFRTTCVLVGLLCVGVLGCSFESFLMPFGSYYYWKNGLSGSTDLSGLADLLSGGTTTSGTTTTGTDGTSTSDTSGSTASSTPSVNDNFDDGNLTGWSILSGNWVVTTDGALQATGPALQGYHIITIGEDTWTNYELELDIMLDAGAEYAVGVRFVNEETWYHCSHTLGGIASVWRFASGQSDLQLANGTSTPLPPGEWYHWKVTVSGNTISFEVEGELVVSATDTSSAITSGKVALLVPAGGIVSFDNVEVRAVGG
ncbi:MAG: DUF1080 domain-containing protein [Phycisphaerae bacterium]|nr:DUF1080 domain-containing protein [Phycisphaerae bacterium]